MNHDLQSGMQEATRLTQAGRLAEATALIQSLFGDDRRTPESDRPSPAPSAGPTLELRPDRVHVQAPERDEVAPNAPARGAGPVRRSLAEVLARLKKGELGIGLDRPSGPGPDGLAGLHRLPGLKRRRAGLEEPLPEGATFQTGQFACAAGSRSYRLYVPGTRQAEGAPLLVMLHGCTQDATDFAAGTAMNRHAERHGCLVLYPEQSQGANAGRCWNWFEPAHQRAGAGEPSIIAGMVRKVIEEHGADPDRVFVAGLSAGGAMAAVMAATHPELFRALGVHSGLAYEVATDVPSAFQAMREASSAVRAVDAPMPTIVFHGEDDRTVHPANGERVVRQWRSASRVGPDTVLTDQGASAGGQQFSRTRTLRPDGAVAVEQWLIHGAGHAWSGGSDAGSYTDPAGPDASAEMLRFFLETNRDA